MSLCGNQWKSTKGKDEPGIRDLVRTIATSLAEDPPGLVVFHFDGDRTWSQYASSENLSRFQRVIVARIKALLDGRNKPEALERLQTMVPFYSIETWL